MTRAIHCAGLLMGLLLTAVSARGAESVLSDGPEWPNVVVDEPQWPNVKLDDVEALRVNPSPAFLDPVQVENRILGRKPATASAANAASKMLQAAAPSASEPEVEITGSTPRWPTLPPEKIPSPFVFEGGARYWYSSGSMKFGFANGHMFFGDPTSTLDWSGLHAHSGELFARIDHLPTGVFAKGVVGLGSIVDGQIVDRDFFVGQLLFSDTTSDVKDGNLQFAMFDIGWAFTPSPQLRLGVFAGYHYWNEKVTAYGVLCNITSILGCTAGQAPIGFDVAVLRYEPTWHAVRIGFDSRFRIDERWSVSGEAVAIPYASLQNKDSHLLRTDLGPSPNVITDSNYAYGVEAELFLNYAVTPNIEISAGARYWGLTSRDGDVRFGPAFSTGTNSLNNFDHQRYGVLLQVKGRIGP